jgi:hypothetical protein
VEWALDNLHAYQNFFKSNEEKFLSGVRFFNFKVFPLTPQETVTKRVNERAYLLFSELYTSCTSSINFIKASQGYWPLSDCIAPLREKIKECRAIAESPERPSTKDQARTQDELFKWHEADIARRIVMLGDKLLKRLS